VIFGIFRAFKQFLDFCGICFRIKNKFEKKKKKLSYWNGPSPKARPAPARLAARQAHRGSAASSKAAERRRRL
jgi:hypothetical protein